MPTDLITVTEARHRVLSAVVPLPPEDVPIAAALDRVLDSNVRAAGNVPPFACSAMDGYAILAGPAGQTLTLAGESRAGAPTGQRLKPGQAIRISTGAALPAGATAVIPQERVSTPTETTITTAAAIADGDHVRGPGEDMTAGITVLRAGTRLGAVELGAAVAAGAGSLSVSRAPRVAVLATGDELRPAGAPLGPGEIHNSNGPILTALAAHAGAQPAPPEQLADDRDATRAGIGRALERSELVIISGGVSVGPHDHVKPALAELGVTEVFWSVALQPGKPTWFGTLGDRLVFGLPGNPVSAVVTFSLFVLPALRALQGASATTRPEPDAVLGVEVKRNPRREQAIRVTLDRGDGPPSATPTGAQGSHMLTSLLGADALAMIPPGEGALAAGSSVRLAELAG
jgi:molybdopterin molybdotransferase